MFDVRTPEIFGVRTPVALAFTEAGAKCGSELTMGVTLERADMFTAEMLGTAALGDSILILH